MLHYLPKQSGLDTAMWQKAGHHLRNTKNASMFVSQEQSVIIYLLDDMDDTRTRGADIGKNARKKNHINKDICISFFKWI